MFLTAVAVTVVTGLSWSWFYAPSVGWSAACLVYVLWVWAAVSRLDPFGTAQRARTEDPARGVADVLILLANVGSLGAVALVLFRANSQTEPSPIPPLLMAVTSVVLSWVLVHTLFMLRYAEQYHLGEVPGGIDFNQDAAPRYSDFAYLAFTIGMTFQVSDTNLQTPAMRSLALRQALLSYLFGTVILATTVNVIIQAATPS